MIFYKPGIKKKTERSQLERILEKEQTDEHGNLTLNIIYYAPRGQPMTTDDKTPHIIWDYNLGRLTSIQGFFSTYNDKVIVVGNTLAPEKTQFVIAHETEHWRRHKTSNP